MPHSRSTRSKRNRITRLIERDGCRCYICGRELIDIRKFPELKIEKRKSMPENWPTVDHVIPESKGGTLAMSNIKLACFDCNTMKADRTLEELCEVLLGLHPKAFAKGRHELRTTTACN